jgi:hypothetical protein
VPAAVGLDLADLDGAFFMKSPGFNDIRRVGIVEEGGALHGSVAISRGVRSSDPVARVLRLRPHDLMVLGRLTRNVCVI